MQHTRTRLFSKVYLSKEKGPKYKANTRYYKFIFALEMLVQEHHFVQVMSIQDNITNVD